MPIRLEIKAGPPFKKLLSYGSILADQTWNLTFKFLDPEKGLAEKAIAIEILGCPHGAFSSEDNYCFIGFGNGVLGDNGSEPFYFVGQYDIRTRTGACEMMTQAEFFSSHVACLLFQDEATRFKKYELARISGKHRVLKVAVECSRIHRSMFLDIVSQADKATLSNVSDADIVITDNPTNKLRTIAPNKAWFVFYGVKISYGLVNEFFLDSDPKNASSEFTGLIERLARL